MLDIQPGRSDFFTEATRLERWLAEPDVGLALDPEWRMGPGQVPAQVIGPSTRARSTRSRRGCRSSSCSRSCRRSSSSSTSSRRHGRRHPAAARAPGLAMVLNADGFGTRELKKVKYKAFTSSPRRFFGEGFKLFYREDTNLMTPRAGAAAQAAARRRGLRVRLPDPCLVVLVGATAAGKSDWARAWFEPDQIVSSDRLRAVVGARRARPAREPRRVRAARPDRGEAPAPAG